MAEFDPPSSEPTPEQQLFARVRLQRVVFGAFAIVLVSLFAIGVSAYRRTQAEREAARQAQGDAATAADKARSDLQTTERKLQKAADELSETRRRLGLAKCRTAMHEIRAGERERAQALLAEARELGPPAWWPMVAHLSREPAVRFASKEHPTAPVIAGAVSRDFSTLAVVRDVRPGFVVLEVLDATSGAVKHSYPPLEYIGGGDPTARLLLNVDGSAWYLSLAGRAYSGRAGAYSGMPSGDTVGWDAATPLAIDADPDLTVVYEAHGPRGLVVRRRDEHDRWETAVIDLEHAPVNAVCVAGLEPVIQAGDGIFRLSGGALTRLAKLPAEPQAVALRFGPGLVYAGVLNGRAVEFIALSLEGESRTVQHEMPDDPFEELRFMGDDTLVWIGRAGRAITMTFAGTREETLGEDTLSFVDRHASGLVFGNRVGKLSLLPRPEYIAGGVPLHIIAPDIEAEAQAHGFVLAGAGAQHYVVQNGRVLVLDSPHALELSPQGPIWFDGVWHFPDGSFREAGAISLGAFADGSLLVHEERRKLRCLGPQVQRECLLPGDRTVDDEAIAAAAPVAALRVNDTVLFADFEGDPRVIAGRLDDVPPDLIALDAAGKRLAVAYGPKLVVHTLAEKTSLTFTTGAAPSKIALLFGGSVLVSLEGGQMVFYETDGGRENLRAGKDVSGIEASSDSSLNIVAGGRLLQLRFGP